MSSKGQIMGLSFLNGLNLGFWGTFMASQHLKTVFRYLKVLLHGLNLLFVEVGQLKDRQISKKGSLDVKLWAQALKIAQIWDF